MKMRWITCVALLTSAVAGADELNVEQLRQQVAKISRQQQQLSDDIQALERLLGLESSLAGLTPLPADKELLTSTRTHLDKASEAFKARDFEEAKEQFQQAWEEAPDNLVTNYNLGLAYHQLGKTSLAKRFLKTALELDGKVSGNKEIRKYLAVDKESLSSTDDAANAARTEMINLKKRANSYLNSKSMPLPERLRMTTKVLREMEQKATDKPALIRDYYLDMGDVYAAMEMHGKAVELLKGYEKSMEGKVLPDGYHGRLLRAVEEQKDQGQKLAQYLNNTPDKSIGRKLSRDLKELNIFANQLDEFVSKAQTGDSDFAKLCERLKEYRWADQPNRHVLVVNRFQELLWSSLEGTLSVDRYQDVDGNKFFKDITLLADQIPPLTPEFCELQLSVNNQKIPYVVMYAYSPKHEAFIIIRLPKRDLI